MEGLLRSFGPLPVIVALWHTCVRSTVKAVLIASCHRRFMGLGTYFINTSKAWSSNAVTFLTENDNSVWVPPYASRVHSSVYHALKTAIFGSNPMPTLLGDNDAMVYSYQQIKLSNLREQDLLLMMMRQREELDAQIDTMKKKLQDSIRQEYSAARLIPCTAVVPTACDFDKMERNILYQAARSVGRTGSVDIERFKIIVKRLD